MKRREIVALMLAVFAAGCRTVPLGRPGPPTPPVSGRPTLEKTFGETRLSPDGLVITFKALNVAVDPSPDLLTSLAPTLDFLFLTRPSKAWPSGVRKDLKIIGPADAAAAARKAGFSNAKALTTGQRLMLSKPGAFVFVSAAPGNGYLLEFDNGRNVFISGDVVDLAPMRELVYGLRDDGKELQLAFINASLHPHDEPTVAELTSLLGPKVAVIIDRGGLDSNALRDAFANQIFDGGWFVAARSDTVPF